jgi:methylglutaconyl-CoA hydratase
MQNSYENIQVTAEGQVAKLWLNRPEQHNAFNRNMVRELTSFFHEAGQSADLRIILMQGNGKSFCAGADLQWMKNSINLSPAENIKETAELSAMLQAIYNCGKVVIGMAHGNIFGGGNGLLAACDLAYCTADSRFSLSETRIGLVAATIAPFLLNRMTPSVVKELVFTAQFFDGNQAERAGLVNRSFSLPEEMESYIDHLIYAVLNGGPVSVTTSKQLINRLTGTLYPEETMDSLAELLATTRISEEAQEGMTAFLEKRKPDWTINLRKLN